MTLIGTVANIMTFITLKKKTNLFSKAIRLLLMNQSIVDGAACLGASILIVQVKTSECLWVPVNSYGYQWILMGTSEFLWVPVNSYGYQSILMGTRQFLWVPGNSYGYQTILMGTSEFLWVPGNSYGYHSILKVQGGPVNIQSGWSSVSGCIYPDSAGV